MNIYILVFGELVRQLRKSIGITLQEMSDFTNITASVLSRVERGEADARLTIINGIEVYFGRPLFEETKKISASIESSPIPGIPGISKLLAKNAVTKYLKEEKLCA